MTQTLSGTRAEAAHLVRELQERICEGVLAVELAGASGEGEAAAFRIDEWRSPQAAGGLSGEGSTRVIADGAVFEKGGVNVSIVTGGALPPALVAQRPELMGHGFFAAGVSVVLHPRNPNAPTAHCNYRYFESLAPDGSPGAWWFGGGSDLTPYYADADDVRHFHRTLKTACDLHDDRFYPAFKAWCDRYFFLRHRNETRGVGGIFYDYLDAEGFGESGARETHGHPHSAGTLLSFMRDAGLAFGEAYFPIVRRRMHEPYGERERSFQLLRRGRYVEFNLVYDRGTTFGLQSGGRTESILMSLPPLARWAYEEVPEPGTREAELAAYLRPREWLQT